VRIDETLPTFAYAVAPLPPGRVGFRRWRWELWQGAVLVSAGWTTAPGDVERALRRAASRRIHDLRGVRALRPERARLLDALRPTAPSRVDTGLGLCLLVPRALEAQAAAA
jgi:hypothetical protein